jgi:proteasome accessory factor A
MRTVSHDPSCTATIELADGRWATATEIQWEYFRLAKKYAQDNEVDEGADEVLDRWEHVLEGLERDPMSLKNQLDWVAKLSVMEAYRSRDGLDWDSPKLRMIDLQYHDVRRPKSLYWKLVNNQKIDRIVTDEEIDYAVDHPPENTRAYFRGECLRRFSPEIVAASWDALIFDLGDEPLRKVPTIEPTRGTKKMVQTLFDSSLDARTLIANLGA